MNHSITDSGTVTSLPSSQGYMPGGVKSGGSMIHFLRPRTHAATASRHIPRHDNNN
jgi:hypothetical protein